MGLILTTKLGTVCYNGVCRANRNTTNLFNWFHTIKSWDNYVLVSYNTSVIPISQTLNFSKLPITQTKSGFPSLTKRLHPPHPVLISQTPRFSLTLEVQEIWILLNVSY